MNEIQEIGKVTLKVKMKRAVWIVVCALFFRPFGTALFWPWRRFLLWVFGAKVSGKAMVNSSTRIWAPWNLEMHSGSCLGPYVVCYNQAKVVLKDNATISQYSYLCTAGHKTDTINNAQEGLIVSAIVLEENSWVGTRAYIGMGVTIGEGSIVGATASVYRDVVPWTIVGGNPAKFIKKRPVSL